MAKGGYRPGAGRPKGAKTKTKKKADTVVIKAAAASEDMTPLEYMLRIMRDPNEDADRRARMAIAAASYVHARAGELGKKDGKAVKAEKAGAGRFKPGAPPKLSRVK